MERNEEDKTQDTKYKTQQNIYTKKIKIVNFQIKKAFCFQAFNKHGKIKGQSQQQKKKKEAKTNDFHFSSLNLQ